VKSPDITNGEGLRVLLVEDVPTDAELAFRHLQRTGIVCQTRRVDTEPEFRRALAEFKPDIILSDYSMPHFDGISALEIARHTAPETPFVFVSGNIGEEKAIDALRLGATDYVLKDNLSRLGPAVQRALQEAQERQARALAEHALRQSEERFRQLAQHAPVGIYIADRNGVIEWANQRLWNIIGLEPKPELIRDWSALVHPEDRDQVRMQWLQAIQERRDFSCQHRLIRHDGTMAWVHTSAVPLSGGTPSHIGTVVDMTDFELQQRKIARLSRIRAVSSAINGAIVRIRDRQALFNEACRVAVDEGGFRLAMIAVLNPSNGRLTATAFRGDNEDAVETLISGMGYVINDSGPLGTAFRERSPTFCNDIERSNEDWSSKRAALERGYRSFAALPLVVAESALEIFVLCAAEPQFFDQEEMHLLEEIASDISFALSYIEKEERLNYLAYYDPLTGLPNRAMLEEQLKLELERRRDQKQPVALLTVMLDGVREIHEALGYTHGDALLRQVGPRLRDFLKENDIVAYQGEDKFGVMLPEADADGAVATARRILTALAQPFALADLSVNIRSSVGISLFPHHAADSHALIRRANLAAQLAKNAEQDHAFYVPGLDKSNTRQLVLAGELRQAIEHGELSLYCQPKIDLKLRAMSGVEALVRWDTGSRGMIPPSEFIPLAERIGLIRPLTQWMLESCVHQADLWNAAGIPIPIAVNLSFHNLHERDLIDRIARLLAQHGTRPELIQLELTESTLMKDPVRALDALMRLRAMGIQLFIDDFGTGYSSLSHLKRLPVHAIKIDKSFVLDMTSSDSNAIVQSTILLAHQLGLRVIAEGVESEKAFAQLVMLGCDEAQGYYIAQPMPAVQLAEWIKNSPWQTPPPAPLH
jgi:diguanylate cyclase (GGDEF)-like protein/PAS domain S-box-containing protein